MPPDSFEQAIKAHLDRLQGALAAEHRVAVEHLEARIAARNEDRAPAAAFAGAGLFHKPPTPSGGGGPGGGRVACGDAVLEDADCEVGRVEPLPSGVSLLSEQPASRHLSLQSERPGSRNSNKSGSQRHPTANEVASPKGAPPRLREGDEPESTRNQGANFRVLDIWDKPKQRFSSRKSSYMSLDRLSNASSQFFISECSDECFSPRSSIDYDRVRWLESKLQPFIISPTSRRHLCWELLGLMLVVYDIVAIPLQILDPPETAITDALSWLVRWFWTLDLAVSFLTGYVSSHGLVELRPARVARQYLRTRFCFDLALVTCDWTEALLTALEAGGSGEGAAAVLGVFRLSRLLRLARWLKISEFIFEHIRSEGVKLVAYILFVVLVLLGLIHVIACLWHGIHSATDGADARLAERYFLAYHTVLSLFAGEQLLEPQNLVERLFVIAVLVFAFVSSAAFVGSLTTAMTQLQVIASKRSTQFASLNRYLSDYGISRQLASRVQQTARHALREQMRHTPESKVELIALISDPLRSEIHYEVFAPVLTAHPFFCLYNKVNPVGVRHICHTAVAPVSLSRGDVIFSEFEVPVVPHMFFVKSGRLVYVRSAEGHKNVGAKQWVSEAVLWTKWAHRGTLRALTESRLLSLNAQRLANIMSTFPTMHGVNYAERFVESLNQAVGSSELTDIFEGEDQVRRMATGVFQELDPDIQVPWENNGRQRRPSVLSVGSLVPGRRMSFASTGSGGRRRPSAVSVVPGCTPNE